MPDPLHGLLSAAAVRERAHEMLDIAIDGGLDGWTVHMNRLGDAAERTANITRERYPDLAIPFHARWRHFVAGKPLLLSDHCNDKAAVGRSAFDLVILSVLLDAGAGAQWRYHDSRTSMIFSRSEGLAVASQRMLEDGFFAADRKTARADGEALAALATDALEHGFQVTDGNPLVGVAGRTALLRRLGQHVMAQPELFGRGDSPRPGGLFDVLVARAQGGRLPASCILDLLLEAFGPIWADRLVIDGVALGDCWRHPAVRRRDRSDGLVPLHKLSQWLAYSLIEPLEQAGIEVVEVDGLTGLAEYRNGGLFIDTGVLALTDPATGQQPYDVSDPLIVAWRSMTVALLDRMAPAVRSLLGIGEEAFPLACMLEGGTWAAGRRIAEERRPLGGPPLTIISDGTVF